jgi:hypothetical protein
MSCCNGRNNKQEHKELSQCYHGKRKIKSYELQPLMYRNCRSCVSITANTVLLVDRKKRERSLASSTWIVSNTTDLNTLLLVAWKSLAHFSFSTRCTSIHRMQHPFGFSSLKHTDGSLPRRWHYSSTNRASAMDSPTTSLPLQPGETRGHQHWTQHLFWFCHLESSPTARPRTAA